MAFPKTLTFKKPKVKPIRFSYRGHSIKVELCDWHNGRWATLLVVVDNVGHPCERISPDVVTDEERCFIKAVIDDHLDESPDIA